MSYTVLARRYRSKDFDDLVGQEPIARTLTNAIASNRVAHAYLFCGTRGVGKTSAARILAKCLNCEKGPTAKPCNVCDRCKAISAGEDIDVLEIDGASNRGIDEIRNLRNNAIFRPARAPYKIYIIDEVHMLTKEAFNALLKTLEEPPSHVKFIFATTEAQKVPQTITSRCQEFNFRLIPTQQIAGQLEKMLKLEKIAADAQVVMRVARAGRGSMRDALSLMDQLLAMGADKVTEPMVEYLLGEPATEQMIALADALAGGDAAGALARTDALLASGFAPEQFALALIEHLRRLMLIGIVGPDCEFLDLASAERQPLTEQARRFKPMTLVYMIELLEQLRQAVRTTTTASRALLDAAMVRLAMLDQFADTAELIERLDGGPSGPGLAPAGAERIEAAGDLKKKIQPALAPAPDWAAPAADPAAPATEAPVPAANGLDLGPPLLEPHTPLEQVAGEELWTRLVDRLSQLRMLTLAGPLRQTRLRSAAGSTLTLATSPELLTVLASPQRQEQIQSVLGRLLGRAVTIEWGGARRNRACPDGPGSLDAGARESGRRGSRPATAGAAAPARLSQREMDRVVQDETIRLMMETFNANVVHVERRPGEPDSTGRSP